MTLYKEGKLLCEIWSIQLSLNRRKERLLFHFENVSLRVKRGGNDSP